MSRSGKYVMLTQAQQKLKEEVRSLQRLSKRVV